MFTLQANHVVSRVVERSQVLLSGNLSTAVESLRHVPREYIEQDVAALGGTDQYDNATLSYGPDADGMLWEIHHSRTLNWWLRHDTQAIATQRFVGNSLHGAAVSASSSEQQPPVEGYRVIAIHPSERGHAILVAENAAASIQEAQATLERADAWTRAHLNPLEEDAYNTLSTNDQAMDDLVRHALGPAPSSPTHGAAGMSSAQRIQQDRQHRGSAESSGPLPVAPPSYDESFGDHNADVTEPASEPAQMEEEEELECPVCMEAINEGDAAMRCTGQGGHRHYFHSHCLTHWIDSCRGNWNEASCPICRGPVEVHSERLADFLNGTQSETLEPEQRGMLQQMLNGLEKGWSTGITKEQAIEGAGILAGLGWGFYTGYNGQAPSSGSWHLDSFVWDNAPNSVRVAALGGWVGGLGIRLLRHLTSDKGKRDKEED